METKTHPPIFDEYGEALPPNVAVQFRAVRTGLEYVKIGIEEILLTQAVIIKKLDALSSRVEENHKECDEQFKSIDSKLDNIIASMGR